MPPEPVIAALRSATAGAHLRLETALDLLAPPLLEARFTRALEAFYGFHRALEPRLAAWIADDAFLAPRSKLAHLERDLAALGRPARRLSAPGLDALDLGFIDSRPAAWGALYVVEGAALGGQVISRALAQAPWLPAGGLRYFNPYGEDVGPMWRRFRKRLEVEVAPDQTPAAAAGASATFKALTARLLVRETVE